MASRQTIGENPLDALIPRHEAIVPSVEADATPSRDTVAERSAPASPEPTASETSRSTARAAVAPDQCLTFYLTGEEYAIGILQIREIVEYEPVTRVPTAPAWIRGVMNLRGTVIPVVDLAVKFGEPRTVITPRTCTVIVETALDGERVVMGVMVDEVHRVLDLGPDDVKAPPVFGTRVHVDYLVGMGEVGERFIPILDLERILSKDELLTAVAVPASASGDED